MARGCSIVSEERDDPDDDDEEFDDGLPEGMTYGDFLRE